MSVQCQHPGGISTTSPASWIACGTLLDGRRRKEGFLKASNGAVEEARMRRTPAADPLQLARVRRLKGHVRRVAQ